MEIRQRRRGGIVIFDLSGKMTMEEGDQQLRDAIFSAMDEGTLNILLNLRGVAAIDSSGVGELLAIHTAVDDRGGRLKLLALAPKVGDVLQMTQITTVIEAFENEAEALASFEGKTS